MSSYYTILFGIRILVNLYDKILNAKLSPRMAPPHQDAADNFPSGVPASIISSKTSDMVLLY